jgi:hypothetical protein
MLIVDSNASDSLMFKSAIRIVVRIINSEKRPNLLSREIRKNLVIIYQILKLVMTQLRHWRMRGPMGQN